MVVDPRGVVTVRNLAQGDHKNQYDSTSVACSPFEHSFPAYSCTRMVGRGFIIGGDPGLNQTLAADSIATRPGGTQSECPDGVYLMPASLVNKDCGSGSGISRWQGLRQLKTPLRCRSGWTHTTPTRPAPAYGG